MGTGSKRVFSTTSIIVLSFIRVARAMQPGPPPGACTRFITFVSSWENNRNRGVRFLLLTLYRIRLPDVHVALGRELEIVTAGLPAEIDWIFFFQVSKEYIKFFLKQAFPWCFIPGLQIYYRRLHFRMRVMRYSWFVTISCITKPFNQLEV